MKENKLVPLVVAFTPNYFVPAVTCLYSVYSNSAAEDKFQVICLLSEKLPQHYMDMLKQFTGDKAEYIFYELKGKLGDVYVDPRYTEAASYRLLLPHILSDYDKVLYIDCDMIIRQNLAELYRYVDFENSYLAGVYEATLDFQIPYLEKLGCKPGEYINSGFLLMNLKLMCEENLSKRLLEALKVDYLEFPDQDAINKVCRGRILALPPYYNSIRTFFLPQYEKNFLTYYSEADLKEVKRKGNIHYTGGKPWNTFTVEFLTWWNYYMQLPDYIKATWKENKKMYWLYRVYKTKVGFKMIEFARRVIRKSKNGFIIS